MAHLVYFENARLPTALCLSASGLVRLRWQVQHAGLPSAIASCQSEATAFSVVGAMKASKGRQGPEAANQVAVCQGVLRLPHVHSLVLITLCTPTHISANSSAAEDTALRDTSLVERAPGLFKDVFESFSVHDWSLFGEE